MDLYQLNTMVANWQSQIYDRDNLIQALANIEHSDFADEILWGRLICYRDVSQIKKIYHNRWSVEKHCDHYEFEAKSQHEVTGKELTKLYNAAKNFYQQQLHVEQASLKFAKNHPDQENPYGYRWDGQTNFLRQSNAFGHTYQGGVWEYQPNHSSWNRWGHQHWHRMRGNWGGGRVGHTQHAFALDNHVAKQERQELDRAYLNTKIRHLNRKYKKNHPIDFPVFDDDEYRQGWHSTGWKHSTKARHQYEQHFNHGKIKGNRKTISKRDVAKMVNDWSQADTEEVEYFVGGEDWLNAPDPNLTSMHDWQQLKNKETTAD